MFEDLLQRMEAWFKAHRPDYFKQLLPGANEEQLDHFQVTTGRKLPDDFRKLYGWRNGQHANAFDSFFENWMFSSLKDIAETVDMLDGMIGEDFDDPKHWRRGWLPLFSNGGGDHYCLDLEAEDFGQPGQLIIFWHDDDERAAEFPSLHAWLEDLVQQMESGTLEVE